MWDVHKFIASNFFNMASVESLDICSELTNSLAIYLPSKVKTEENINTKNRLPHVTVTYAASLESAIAIAPKTTTLISGYQSKAMTHYLRAKYDAILIGSTTAITDDPRLTSRWIGVNTAANPLDQQPRPIIMDPSGRWLNGLTGEENLLRIARNGHGHAPWVITDKNISIKPEALTHLLSTGGRWLEVYLNYEGKSEGVNWEAVLSEIVSLGILSLMIEGGATVINDLLRKKNRHYITSIIVTIAPIYLGTGGVVVSPQRIEGNDDDSFKLREIRWIPMGNDVVMAALS